MRKDYILVAGFTALAVFATAGWMKTPVPASDTIPAARFQPLAGDTPVLPQAEPAASQALYSDTTQPSIQTVAHRRPNRAAYNRNRVYDRYRDSDEYRDYRRDRRDDDRSVGESVAIVGGSAGAGAAIGGLAGGGKGAALGAIIGGTGGFVYDRLTRDKDNDRYRRNRR